MGPGMTIGLVAFLAGAVMFILWASIGILPGRGGRLHALAVSMGAKYEWRSRGRIPFGFGPKGGRAGWWLHEIKTERGDAVVVFGDLPATSAGVGRAVSFVWEVTKYPLRGPYCTSDVPREAI